ncbi:tagaturonate reductase [uncultured Formosa sp.]|uniref:tagaturonate reductase n=1 Tax=uncultured Formosa sp. TaxID=255435 RepID=UPI002604009C|nr:tagaturonate reductase [uncultured Formosa sp.]
MKNLNRESLGLDEKLPLKIVQFGEGNFLRAFVGYAIQHLNKNADFNAGIAVVQPINSGLVKMLNDQDGLYTLFMKGIKKGKEIQEHELITNIVRSIDPYLNFQEYISLAKEDALEFIISNTTEAGINYVESDTLVMQPPSSFPAKLTILLNERFKYYKGDSSKGLTIIPCELINHNSETLKNIILQYVKLWKLGEEFKVWVSDNCSFHSTLVDRIVPGYPKDEIEDYNHQLDYKDNLIVSAEAFFLWVIEGGEELKKKLPFDKTDLDVKIVDDMQPYRTRKVKILNGAHTAMVPFCLLSGKQTVKESVDDVFTGEFIENTVFNEIIPTLDMDKDELKQFGEDVFDRFRNPFVKHQLSSIALNSISKFKVRVLPSLLDYIKINDKLPIHLMFSFACLLRFYKGTWLGDTLPVNDDAEIVKTFEKAWALGNYEATAKFILENKLFWGEDLTRINNFTHTIVAALIEIDTNSTQVGFINFSKQF